MVIYEKCSLSPKPVDRLYFDNTFLETDIAQRMIFNGIRSGIFHNRTVDVDPGHGCIEKFGRSIHWYMMESKNCISNFSFRFKN